jgi:putative endonuclease
MNTTAIGKLREAEGLAWLEKQIRLRVLQKNYRTKAGEIDLIIEHEISNEETDLVFIEIRSREKSDFITPIDTLRPAKVRRMRNVATQFLAEYKGRATGVRFDLLCFENGLWSHILTAL